MLRRTRLDWRGAGAYSPRVCPKAFSRIRPVLKKIFTWWNGATLGVLLTVKQRATFVGEDDFGNRYYAAKTIRDGDAGRQRRWVIYKGYAEPSKVPAEWHGWLHHTFAEPPTKEPLKRRSWELDHQSNLTGTAYAYKPQGSISHGGERQKATGDYQAWRPE